MKIIKFVDAQKMQEQHPFTFEAPTQEELEKILPGDIVKVCVEPERFWCIVKYVETATIIAEVNNDLVYSDIHGLVCGDLITFEKRHIYNTCPPE
jgi:hypothetical protein